MALCFSMVMSNILSVGGAFSPSLCNVYVCHSTAEPFVQNLRAQRMKRSDFDIIKVIGRGAFSEVRPELGMWR